MFNAQGLFADAGQAEKLEDCGGVGDAQGRSLIGITNYLLSTFHQLPSGDIDLQRSATSFRRHLCKSNPVCREGPKKLFLGKSPRLYIFRTQVSFTPKK